MIGKALWAAGACMAALAASPAIAQDCGDLAGKALASGQVTSATLIPPGGFEQPPSPFGPPPGVANAAYRNLPAFCRVEVTLTPSADSDIKAEVWLPAQGWNGKLVGLGNGIWAGQISYSQMGDPLSRGYAVVSTDTGHTGSGMTSEWGIGHPEKLVDFGHRAVHEMTVAAKQAIREFYGRGPELSLWNSCSTGGRQGLMAAYRYPEDYDAISAMAPANPMTGLMVQTMWTGFQALRTPQSRLSPATLGLVHKAAVAQCDALDGLEDGLISRPDQCRFDPAALQCKPGESGTCLAPAQVEALRGIYGGVRDRSGALLLPGFPFGSEMQLAAIISGDEPFPVATSYFRNFIHADQPDWDWRTMDYPRDLAAARAHGASLFDVPPDGLDAFFARGGKLLLSHGWSDGLIPATNTLQFYYDLYHALPQQATQAQLRLFMAPGMDHCSGGNGPSQFDTLGIIDEWASGGAAPGRIIATRAAPAPGAPALPAMSRPLCAYPLVARYNGRGSTAEAENFTCVIPD